MSMTRYTIVFRQAEVDTFNRIINYSLRAEIASETGEPVITV